MKDHGYTVEVSTNLINWDNVYSFVAFEDTFTFSDAEARTTAHRFFRIKDTTANMPPPSNDNFENRIPLSGVGITVEGYTANATMEPDEQLYGPTVWWSWTAPISGGVVIRPANGINAFINVYSGSTLRDLEYVSCSWETFEVVAGKTYQLQVCGPYIPPGGVKFIIGRPPTLTVTSPVEDIVAHGPTNILISASATAGDSSIAKLEFLIDGVSVGWTTNSSLTVNCPFNLGNHGIVIEVVDKLGLVSMNYSYVTVRPENDDFANATPISGAALTVQGSNVEASWEEDEYYRGEWNGGVSVWWAWTAPSNGDFTVSTELAYNGSPLHPFIGVYTGNSLSDLSEVGSSQDDFSTGSATVSFSATSGTVYYIRVDETWGWEGDITLKVIPSAAPSVTLISPEDGTVLYGKTNLTLTATANDSDGVVRFVNFYAVNYYEGLASQIGCVSNSPYTMVWSNVMRGGYYLFARATDNMGASANSSHISLVPSPPPTVQITSPTYGGMYYTPTDINITATASDSATKVDFFYYPLGGEGHETLIGSVSNSPCNLVWSNVPAGTYYLYARATDAEGLTGDSDWVYIEVY